jgi:hypothetical protein
MLSGIAYPPLLPLDTTFIDALASSWSCLAPTQPILVVENEPALALGESESTSTHMQPAADVVSYPLTGPEPTPEYCDSRLRYLDISYWTTVPLSNTLAISAISFYLANYHPISGFFDADLVLGDLVDQRLSFCSFFFVNALLFLACVCNYVRIHLANAINDGMQQLYACVDVTALSYDQPLFNETYRLWLTERNNYAPVTLSATMLFGHALTSSGRGQLKLECFSYAREMATHMQLFGVAHTITLERVFQQARPQRLRESAHAAWGAYNWLA